MKIIRTFANMRTLIKANDFYVHQLKELEKRQLNYEIKSDEKFDKIFDALENKQIHQQLQLDIKKYNQQYNNLELKITKNFHDRFLILDTKEIYHIGASLKDLGSKIFAFSKISIDYKDILKGL